MWLVRRSYGVAPVNDPHGSQLNSKAMNSANLFILTDLGVMLLFRFIRFHLLLGSELEGFNLFQGALTIYNDIQLSFQVL